MLITIWNRRQRGWIQWFNETMFLLPSSFYDFIQHSFCFWELLIKQTVPSGVLEQIHRGALKQFVQLSSRYPFDALLSQYFIKISLSMLCYCVFWFSVPCFLSLIFLLSFSVFMRKCKKKVRVFSATSVCYPHNRAVDFSIHARISTHVLFV